MNALRVYFTNDKKSIFTHQMVILIFFMPEGSESKSREGWIVADPRHKHRAGCWSINVVHRHQVSCSRHKEQIIQEVLEVLL